MGGGVVAGGRFVFAGSGANGGFQAAVVSGVGDTVIAGRSVWNSRSLSRLKARECGVSQHLFWQCLVRARWRYGRLGNDIAMAPAASHAKAWESGVM